MKKTRLIYALCSVLMMGIITTGCKDDEGGTTLEDKDPIASFQAAVDETNFLEVTFTNFSQNATSYTWDFGDGAGTSTEENPVYTYTVGGKYSVKLTAANDAGLEAEFIADVTVTDPDEAAALLTGISSKTWKLYAEEDSVSMWKTGEGAWTGLKNNGERPCLYDQTITFKTNLDYVFDDAGSFWGEYGVWGHIEGFDDTPYSEICFPAEAANMVNAKGEDVSAWLSGTHKFEYDTQNGSLTLTGDGAWIGIPKLATTGELIVPSSSVTCSISINDSNPKYDLMTVIFDYTTSVWTVRYASYHDVADEPTIVTEVAEVVDSVDELTLDTFSHSFASVDGAVSLDSISGGSVITLGVADPADGTATAVGQFYRSTAEYQEAKLQLTEGGDVYDIGFDNITTVSIEVYLPSSNVYTGDLTQGVLIGLANEYGNPGNWWEDVYNYESATDLPLDTWNTVEFTLATDSNRDDDPTVRTDLDLIYIQIGGAGHFAEGTFYIRNLKFE